PASKCSTTIQERRWRRTRLPMEPPGSRNCCCRRDQVEIDLIASARNGKEGRQLTRRRRFGTLSSAARTAAAVAAATPTFSASSLTLSHICLHIRERPHVSCPDHV